MQQRKQRRPRHHSSSRRHVDVAGLKPPKPFDFHNAADWPAWIDEFDDYRIASGLHEKPELVQERTLLYTMGWKSLEILRSVCVKDKEFKKFDLIKSRLDGYLVHTKNVVYVSARFNQRRQQLGETVEQFATVLHRLAERWKFKDMKERLIRDQFVVGLLDQTRSEVLQMNPKLTLQIALSKTRTSETVKKQQAELAGQESASPEACVSAVKQENTARKSEASTSQRTANSKKCSYCAGPLHPRTSCPVKREKCRFCQKLGHFEKACSIKKRDGKKLDVIAAPDN
ncbi:uncharacterized protein LOC120850778 [Ixodes scapularis]|uniref:uncharacterized protein LOC120850778 n=1 Tax=Ixodes scapularis TaxID=6945 RepID=UPI001A9DF34A|nr:uncharacterized protein LOC120850778 [Ixodes scapularis]